MACDSPQSINKERDLVKLTVIEMVCKERLSKTIRELVNRSNLFDKDNYKIQDLVDVPMICLSC